MAELPGFEIVWEAGAVRVRPDVLTDIEDRGLVARTALAARCLKLQAEIERRLTLPAYDPEGFEADDRPFRVMPGSPDHARLVFEALGADLVLDVEDEADDLAELEAELAALDA